MIDFGHIHVTMKIPSNNNAKGKEYHSQEHEDGSDTIIHIYSHHRMRSCKDNHLPNHSSQVQTHAH